MRQKGFAPILLVIVVAVLAGVGYWGYKSGIIKKSLPQKKAGDDASPTPTTDETADWKTHENVGYRIRFKYPPESSIKELYGLGPNYFQINLLENSQKAQGIFMIKTVYEADEVQDFVGTNSEDVKNINGQTWYYFNFPQGYSNSPPFTVYQDEKNGILYSFKFYNLISDELRDQIMATIEIIP